jgi:hypothetical protein
MIRRFLAELLLAIDAQVLAFLVRPAGDHQRPGDQRRGVTRPAVLDRQAVEVDVVAFEYHLLHRGAAHVLGPCSSLA